MVRMGLGRQGHTALVIELWSYLTLVVDFARLTLDRPLINQGKFCAQNVNYNILGLRAALRKTNSINYDMLWIQCCGWFLYRRFSEIDTVILMNIKFQL